MKKPALLAGAALLLSCSFINAQEGEKKEPSSTNPTVTAITSKYQLVDMPEALTVEKVFPVIGSYESASASDAPLLTISLDPANKAYIWITGLPQGSVKAILYKSPATYKIVKQTTEEGNEIPEGTLIYDKEMNVLNICLGKKFDNANPASAFTAETASEEKVAVEKSKGSKPAKEKETKSKPWLYTGTKQTETTVKIN